MHVQHQQRTYDEGNDRVPVGVSPKDQRERCEASGDKNADVPAPKPSHLPAGIRVLVHIHSLVQQVIIFPHILPFGKIYEQPRDRLWKLRSLIGEVFPLNVISGRGFRSAIYGLRWDSPRFSLECLESATSEALGVRPRSFHVAPTELGWTVVWISIDMAIL